MTRVGSLSQTVSFERTFEYLSPAPRATPRCSVVIPTYNRRSSVLRLLSNINNQKGVDFEIIVVDDNSTDNTCEAIARDFPTVIVLRHETNRGPAAARNEGVLAARTNIVVGLDSDVTVIDTALLANVVALFESSPDTSCAAFRILAADGGSDDALRWWHSLPLEQYASSRFPTHYFSGTGFAFRRNAMLRAGLFPEFLFMHYEEVRLAYRVLDDGGVVEYIPHLVVIHNEVAAASRRKVHSFYKPRNQILLAINCLPLSTAILYVIPRLFYGAAVAVARAEIGDFLAALRSAAAITPIAWKSRRPVARNTLSRIAQLRRGNRSLSRHTT